MNRSALNRFLVALLLFSTGCRDTGGEDYVALSGRVFIFNYRIATATYVVTFTKARIIPDGATLVAEFENPAGGDAIRIEQKVWPKLDKIALESPPLTCVAKGKAYKISVTLLGVDKRVLQRINTTLTSTLDQSVLPERPLVVGPGYTPNPELSGHPDGKLPMLPKVPCP